MSSHVVGCCANVVEFLIHVSSDVINRLLMIGTSFNCEIVSSNVHSSGPIDVCAIVCAVVGAIACCGMNAEISFRGGMLSTMGFHCFQKECDALASILVCFVTCVLLC